MGKRQRLLLCAAALSVLCLGGCGKETAAEETKYPAGDVLSLEIKMDTWRLELAASSDDNIHISYDGSDSGKDKEPEILFTDNVLAILQESGEDGLQEQIALGKKGQITLSIPEDCAIPIKMNNGSGDISADGITVTDFQLINNSGYVTFSNLKADRLEIDSTSGDVTGKESEAAHTAIHTTSGYVQLDGAAFGEADIVTKSGEINISGASPMADMSLKTGSGDISLSYRTAPDNLKFSIASGSKDISARLKGADFSKETSECREGVLGSGQYQLLVNSESGTVVIQ